MTEPNPPEPRNPLRSIERIALAFDHRTVLAVWEKTVREPGFETFALDALGSLINRFDYGKHSEYGWVIKHIVPVESGGTSDVDNLEALHWKHIFPDLPPASGTQP